LTGPSPPRTIVLYGGSFDPIHSGHLHVARACLERPGIDQVRFLITPQPPHKRGRTLLPLADRVALVEAAIAGEPRFAVDLTETELAPPWYTFDTLRAVRARVGPGHDVCFVIGADSLADLPKWHRARELVHETQFLTVPRDPHVSLDAVFERLGHVFPAADVERLRSGVLAVRPLPISSTQIRDAIRTGQSIEGLVPPAVAATIAARGHYRSFSDG
jgi:nicotinate-nucleotide adenylyltransferase